MGDIDCKDSFDIKNNQLRKCLFDQKHICVPDGVSVVQEGAFSDCSLLETIEFPDSMRMLVMGWGNKEFANSPNLHTVKLGKNLEQYNLKLPIGTKVIFPKRFESFYNHTLAEDEMVKLLYGLYSRNQGQANYTGFVDLIYVYLHYPSPKVAHKCQSIMLANIEECLPILNEQLPSLSAGELGLAQSFIAKYDRSRDLTISTSQEAYQYCQKNYKTIIGNNELPGINIDDEALLQLHYQQDREPVPGLVGRFVLLFYMTAPGLYWDHNCEQIIAMIDEDELAEVCEKIYTALLEAGWEALQQNQDFIKAYCRFALPAQIRELKEHLPIWQAKGSPGIEFVSYFKQALALNKSLASLLLLDKLDALNNAARIREISVETLRESLIPDLGFDQNASLRYDLGDRQLQVNLAADLSIELFDEALGRNIHAFPALGEDEDSKLDLARSHYLELKETIKDIQDNQLAFMKRQFVFGVTRSSSSWLKIYSKNPVLRRLAEGIVWRCANSDNKETFMIRQEGTLIDAKGDDWQLPGNGKISIAHPLYLTAEEMDFWVRHVNEKGLKQPITQLSEAIIPFSSENDIKNRYLSLKVTLRMIKLIEEEGFKIYGLSKFGYQLDNDIVRVHFDPGLLKSLSQTTLDDDMFLQQLHVINLNRARPINHSLAVLDRLAIMADIKEDKLSPLIEYIKSKEIGLAEEEINQYLEIANQYQSFDCTAYLLNYKHKKSKFELHHGDLWL